MRVSGIQAPRAERDVDGVLIRRASERVELACRALSEAANDLHVAYARSGIAPVADAAGSVQGETERVCELSEELVKLATNVCQRHLLALAGGSGK